MAWLAVVRAYQLCNRRYEQMLARFELTVPQFDALDAIAGLGDRALPKHVASSMLVTRGNVTGILDRLQRRALIELRPHPDDRRARLVSLTDRGHRLLRVAREAAGRFIAHQMAPFDDAEVDRTRRTMERMLEHLRTLDPDRIADDAVDPETAEEPA